jgi:hypothetical protein
MVIYHKYDNLKYFEQVLISSVMIAKISKKVQI